MRALPLFLLPALALTGCIDDPCNNQEGPWLYVYGEAYDSRLEGNNSTAFGSIADALEAAEPGAAICVSGGTWQERVAIGAEGTRLIAAGPGETILEAPPDMDADEALLTVDARDVLVRGITVRGAPVGLAVTRASGATLEDLSLEDNEVGLVADGPAALSMQDVDLERNRWLGAELRAGYDDPQITLRGGQITGNGDISASPVGGLRSELDLVIEDALIRDNAGRDVGDLEVLGSLEMWTTTIERPRESMASAPRVRAGDGLTLIDSQLHLDGSPGLDVRCEGGGLRLENVIITDAAQPLVQDQLLAEDCSGEVLQSTFVNLGGGSQGSAIALAGEGEVTVANTALVGYDYGVATSRWDGQTELTAIFEGTLTEAQLLRPIAPDPDLRPQTDSPLLDSGTDLGVPTDIQGAVRPRGGGYDIGAYEY
jgi:hypothetical protein